LANIIKSWKYYLKWGAWVAQWVRSLDLTTHTSLSPIRRGFKPDFVHYKTGCTRLAAACDKAYQLLAHGRWFSPGTLASFTTKTGRHDIAEILLRVALKHQKTINQSIVMLLSVCPSFCQSFCNIFVNTLEATSFIPFWPNLVHTLYIHLEAYWFPSSNVKGLGHIWTLAIVWCLSLWRH
jgi:hypothetical protein